MTINDLKQKWPMYLIMILANIFLIGLASCPPTTPSLFEDGKKITRPELQLELDTIIAKAELRLADLDKQQRFRDIILKNALVMVETGTFNPLGLATALFAFYGIGAATTACVKRLKKKPPPT